MSDIGALAIISGLSILEFVRNNFTVSSNEVLTDVSGLPSLTSVGRDLTIELMVLCLMFLLLPTFAVLIGT